MEHTAQNAFMKKITVRKYSEKNTAKCSKIYSKKYSKKYRKKIKVPSGKSGTLFSLKANGDEK